MEFHAQSDVCTQRTLAAYIIVVYLSLIRAVLAPVTANRQSHKEKLGVTEPALDYAAHLFIFFIHSSSRNTRELFYVNML